MNGTILTNRSAIDRSKTDFYPTPPDVTVALLRFLRSRFLLSECDLIWEPACGDGDMAKVMEKKGYSVTASDLYRTDYATEELDFLTADRRCDWIITNPPFSQAEAFIRHALELGKPCAFLLKSQFWHAQRRQQLFHEHTPAYVLPLTWRPDFLMGAKSGSPTMEVLWTVWCGERTAPLYIPLQRPEVSV